VRHELLDARDQPVLIACSGGADSLALLAAAVFEARRAPWHVVGVTVDHGLQDGSAEHARRVVAQMQRLGAAEVRSVVVDVTPRGRGVEAAAREARYAALTGIAEEVGAEVALLGHTLDDQAETVLLGLARGSGGRALAGMRPIVGIFRRPLLCLTRAETEAACTAAAIDFWEDPHNADPRFTRARVRHRVMPVLERELGPGVAAALARTADMLRQDISALDDQAEAILGEYRYDEDLEVDRLEALHDAIRLRVLRLAALRAGSPAGELFRSHVLAVDELVHGYRGQLRIELPGHVHVVREGNALSFRRTGPSDGATPVAG